MGNKSIGRPRFFLVWMLPVVLLFFLCVSACSKTESPPKQTEPVKEKASRPQTPAPLSTTDIEAKIGSPPEGGYRILAIKVGETEKAKKRLFYSKAEKKEKIPVVFFFQVLQGGGKTILVDAGFVDEKKIEQWRVKNYRSPEKGLAAAGIQPQKITDIIVTHRHWDHIGGISRFPNARLWMAQKEYQRAVKHFQKKDPVIAKALSKAKEAGMVAFTKKVQQIFPGVTVVRQGKHTRHFQYVVVQNNDGRWVLASDEGPLFLNYQGPTASGLTKDPKRSVMALNTMLSLVNGKPERIIPGHDPEVFKRFPVVKPGVVEISSGKSSVN